jgi:pyruvate/2-oxoglutarate/acetoin dehydrogenase E1 component
MGRRQLRQSCGASVVEVEVSAEAFSALDRALVVHGGGNEKPIADALMISFAFVVLDKLTQSAAQVRLAKRNNASQAL